MATSKPTTAAAKRSPIPRQTISVPTVPTMSSAQKPETNHPRRSANSPVPLSPSTTKRPTAPFSKTVATGTTLTKTKNPKSNPAPVITPPKDKVQSFKSIVETAQSPSLSNPTLSTKPKTETAVARSSSSKRNSTKGGGKNPTITRCNSVSGVKTGSKIGGTSKLTSTRCPSAGGKTATKSSLYRVSSLPDLFDKSIDMQRIKEAEAGAEEDQEVNISPSLEKEDEKTELMPVSLSAEEEEEKKGLVETGAENEGQNETNTEIEVNKEEKETIEELVPKSVSAEPIAASAIQVPAEPVQAVSVQAVPVQAVPALTIPATTVPASTVPAVAAQGKEGATSNDAIEEIRNKLIGERSKVKALVGAFESVMKEKEGESQPPSQSGQNNSQTGGQRCESNPKEDDVEEVQKLA